MDAQPSVLSFICAAIGRFHDAEDVLQEVAVDVAENFSQYDRNRPFVAWAIGIARFKIAAYYRDRGRQQCLLDESLLENLCEAHVTQHDHLGEMRQALEDCLERLAPKARSLVQMRYQDDLRSPQLAERLGSTSGSVRVALTRIRNQPLDCIRGKLAQGAAS